MFALGITYKKLLFIVLPIPYLSVFIYKWLNYYFDTQHVRKVFRKRLKAQENAKTLLIRDPQLTGEELISKVEHLHHEDISEITLDAFNDLIMDEDFFKAGTLLTHHSLDKYDTLSASLLPVLQQDINENPEQTSDEIRQKFPGIRHDTIYQSGVFVFKEFINQKYYDKARILLDYQPVDEHNLLPVMEALDLNAQSGTLDLSPQTYKITMDDHETAYEKLPCNWQKIHTYLAPNEDELEQADILDSGNIYITDQRVFFVGKKGSETVYLQDIAFMKLKEDAIQFFRDEGLSEIFAFPTAHHASYAHLIIQQLVDQ